MPARRIQLVVAIDRLLARLLVSAPQDSWVVKGGFANQLRRPDEARFTEDIDLRIASTIEAGAQPDRRRLWHRPRRPALV